ncbi:MAG: MbcA/ParS/Xre antitoxin family protein [Steroidobacteraceae bacterium]
MNVERVDDTSEPVLRAVRQLAASVFDSVERADAWLREPNVVLNGQPPLAAIETLEGHRAVVAELKRLDYNR